MVERAWYIVLYLSVSIIIVIVIKSSILLMGSSFISKTTTFKSKHGV